MFSFLAPRFFWGVVNQPISLLTVCYNWQPAKYVTLTMADINTVQIENRVAYNLIIQSKGKKGGEVAHILPVCFTH